MGHCDLQATQHPVALLEQRPFVLLGLAVEASATCTVHLLYTTTLEEHEALPPPLRIARRT